MSKINKKITLYVDCQHCSREFFVCTRCQTGHTYVYASSISLYSW